MFRFLVSMVIVFSICISIDVAYSCDENSNHKLNGRTEPFKHRHTVGKHADFCHTHIITGKSITGTVSSDDRNLNFNDGFHHAGGNAGTPGDREGGSSPTTTVNGGENPGTPGNRQNSPDTATTEPSSETPTNTPSETASESSTDASSESESETPIDTLSERESGNRLTGDKDLQLVGVRRGWKPARIYLTVRNTNDRFFQSLYGLTLQMRDKDGKIKRSFYFYHNRQGLSITYQKSVGEPHADTDLVLFPYQKGFEKYPATAGKKKFVFPYRIKSVGGYKDTDVFVLMCEDVEMSRYPEAVPMSPIRQSNMATTWASMKAGFK